MTDEQFNELTQLLNTIISNQNEANTRLDTLISRTEDIRGEVPSIKKKVENIRLIHIYTGDRAEKRAMSEKQMAELQDQGYRPYLNLGLDEDYARWAYAKYVDWNAPEGV